MQDKTKNLIVVITFCLILIFILVSNCFAEDIEISILERRKLAKFPKITVECILNRRCNGKI